MAIKTARDVMAVVEGRGLRLAMGPWCSPFPPAGNVGLLVVRPSHVSRDEVTPALLNCVLAWRVEIIEELSRKEG